MKHLTILHANDIHGQLAFKIDKDFVMRGGISMFANYVRRTRNECSNLFFGICGDVLQEDISGTDYKGRNTVALLNTLRPDAFSLGNHEFDYGLSHLLIFDRCLNTDTLNANIFVDEIHHPLFVPSKIYKCGDVKVLVIGLIPESFFKKIYSDEFCRHLLSYRDSYQSIRDEIDMHKAENPDLTVIMSHYGIEGDIALAENMPEDCKVDLILGGHTHIDMDEAKVVNGIPIAQSSYGTTHIGRFDIDIDTVNGGIAAWKWERVEITDDNCEFDRDFDELTDSVVFTREKPKAKKKLCDMAEIYHHESRLHETELGDIVADAFMETYKADLYILQSGSIRANECTKEIYSSDLRVLYPFDDEVVSLELTGKELKEMFDYLFSLKPDGSIMNGTFQYSRGFRLVVDATDSKNKGCKVLEISLNGQDIEDDKVYNIVVSLNCLSNFPRYFNKVYDKEDCKLVSLSSYHDLAKWFIGQKEPVAIKGKGRFTLLNYEG